MHWSHYSVIFWLSKLEDSKWVPDPAALITYQVKLNPSLRNIGSLFKIHVAGVNTQIYSTGFLHTGVV